MKAKFIINLPTFPLTQNLLSLSVMHVLLQEIVQIVNSLNFKHTYGRDEKENFVRPKLA